jgi:hypothetical protein
MFTILTDSRCGSHMLRSLLSSHPQLYCYDEILGNRKGDKDFRQLGKYEGCLAAYQNLIEGDRFATHGYNISKLIEQIQSNPVIHLTRDVTERAKSQLVYGRASKRLKIFRAANLEEPADIGPEYENFNPEDIERTCEMFLRRQAAGLALFENRDSWLELSYEWLCGDQELSELSQHKSAVICDHLQVPVTKLACSLYKIRKYAAST